MYLFSIRTPRSKPQPTLPPHVSLFLHLPTPSLIKNCRPWLLIKSHLKSLKVRLRLIQFAFLNREHCLKGLINWTKKKKPSFFAMPSELVRQHPKRNIHPQQTSIQHMLLLSLQHVPLRMPAEMRGVYQDRASVHARSCLWKNG